MRMEMCENTLLRFMPGLAFLQTYVCARAHGKLDLLVSLLEIFYTGVRAEKNCLTSGLDTQKISLPECLPENHFLPAFLLKPPSCGKNCHGCGDAVA
jgi:hypothetical protein